MGIVSITPADSVATIQGKFSAANTGDTVQFAAGTYPQLTVAVKNNMIIEALGPVRILGAKQLTGWTESATSNVWQVTGQTQAGTSGSSGELRDASGDANKVHPEDLAICTNGWDEFTILDHAAVADETELSSGEWWFDYTNDIIYMYSTVDPDTLDMWTSDTFEFDSAGATGVEYRNLNFALYANRFGKAAIRLESGSKMINCDVGYCHGANVQIRHNTLIVGSHIHHAGQINIKSGDSITSVAAGYYDNASLDDYIPSRYTLIAGNEIDYGNHLSWVTSNEDGGIKISHMENLLALDNYIHDNEGPGLWFDINFRNCWAIGNICYNNYREGIKIETGYKVYVFNNWCGHNGRNQPAPATTFGWGAQIQASTAQENDVRNNVCVVAATHGNGLIVIHQDRQGSSGLNLPGFNSLYAGNTDQWEANGNVIDGGNIVIHLGTNGYNGINADTGLPFGGAATSNFWTNQTNTFDNNTYYVTNTSNTQFRWNGSSLSFSDWQSTYSQEAGGSVTASAPASSLTDTPSWTKWTERDYKDRYNRDDTLLGYWILNDADTTITDFSGNGYTGTLQNAAGTTYQQTGIGDGETALQWNASNTARIDLHTASINTGLETAINGNNRSARIWGYHTADPSPDDDQYLWRVGKGSASATFLQENIRRSSGDNLQLYLQSGSGTSMNYNATGGAFPDNTWERFIITQDYDENAIRGFRNGAAVHENTSPTLTDVSAPDLNDRIMIGARDTSQEFWLGKIAHAKLFNRPTAAPEAWIDYRYNKAPALSVGNQSDLEGETINLDASGTDLGTLTYYAVGLPDGLSINSGTGAITGTLTTPGTYNVVIAARDDDATLPLQTVDTFTWTVTENTPTTTLTGTFNGTEGAAFSLDLNTYFDSPNELDLTITLQSGSLAGWMDLTDGVLSGTPGTSDAGSTTNLVFRATDTNGLFVDGNAITITIAEGTPTFSDPGTLNGVEGVAFSHDLNNDFDDPNALSLTITLQSGTLPAWASLLAGVISGTPLEGDDGSTGSLVFRATNPNGLFVDSSALTISITEATPVISTPSAGSQQLTENTPYSFDLDTLLTDPAGTPGGSWSTQSGTLPTGLSRTGSTVSGTPTVVGGPTAVTFRFTDTDGLYDEVTFNYVVSEESVPTTPDITTIKFGFRSFHPWNPF